MAGSKKLEGKHGHLAERMLKAVAKIFAKANIDYILDGGTLLGIVRENRLLPWDSDVDLSIRTDQVEKVLKIRWKLWLIGYRTRIKYFKKDVGPFKQGDIRIIKIQTRIFFVKQYDMIDIFVKRKFDDEYLNVVGEKPAIMRNFPPHLLEESTYLDFNGQKYMAPKDYTGYLTRIYGDWKTPVKEWDYKKDNKCVKKVLGNI